MHADKKEGGAAAAAAAASFHNRLNAAPRLSLSHFSINQFQNEEEA